MPDYSITINTDEGDVGAMTCTGLVTVAANDNLVVRVVGDGSSSSFTPVTRIGQIS